MLGLGLILGLGLALDEAALKSLLSTFIGIYLLGSGIMSFIWGYSNRKRRGLWLLAGTLGLIGGLTFIVWPLTENVLAPNLPTAIFGIVIVLTGVVHMLGGYRVGEKYGRKWVWQHFFLGLIEIGMGLVIMASPAVTAQASGFVMSIWGLMAGMGLIADAVRLRRIAR